MAGCRQHTGCARYDSIATKTGPTPVGPNSGRDGKGHGHRNSQVGALGGRSQPNQRGGGDTAQATGGVERGGGMKGLIALSLAFAFITVMFLVGLNVWAGV